MIKIKIKRNINIVFYTLLGAILILFCAFCMLFGALIAIKLIELFG